MGNDVTLSLDDAGALCRRVLAGVGLSAAHADAVAEVIMAAERDECRSHGLYRLLGCVHTVRSGKVNLDARPTVTKSAPAIVTVDADFGFSSLALKTGLPLAMRTASRLGIAALAINRCFHFSALWPEVEELAEHGFAAIALTPSHSWVAPAGGSRPVFGTNPFAFAWPRQQQPPFIFDFATSATARGDIELMLRAGRALPPGVAIDAQGDPTTDPAEALRGAMLTFGGHKGSALAAMVELLAGPLIGDMLSLESLAFAEGTQTVPCHGELLVILDPARFLGDRFGENLDRAERLFDAITEQGARLPSERRYNARSRSIDNGIKIPYLLHEELMKLEAAADVAENV
ncbi:Ldh family oxidoreductase [Ancylobacter amanitiformis]|uniref:LDH2 family malate/lactate/ureidoglycolate dehydrogenase n=1 Tax=Ancylobacter amanitiformis TaxID=217069 RepID=A0ABU0LXF7_9HYPH|nr:Ldh family oxidoreductase [Ancylobacter amanitiformis]MDQ0513391.1 LDH2 family malate/lactate/ureidoglycolate dehydrogenase [Ancylobacter amanitiformis]